MSRDVEKARAEYRNTHPVADVEHLLSDDELVTARALEALEAIANFKRMKPTGDPGSYQRGYDIGFNNAGLVAAGIAEAALVSLKGGGGSSRTETASGAPSAALASETQRKSEWKVGDRARVVADNEYSDGAEDIGAEFTVEGLREGSRGRTVLLTGKATRGFDGFYAERCERVADE